MLRFAQHDRPMSFRTLFFVIPSACEESSTWMLRFAQHDKTEDVIPNTLFCHSERQRGIQHMDASLRSV
jgi:hypothetical protein